MRSCLFCGTTDPLTQEHVFPRWIRASGSRPLEGIEQASHLPTPRRADCYAWKVKLLCRQCNNEWGSTLEEAAKPALRLMIDGQPASLDLPMQAALGKWAYKTALVTWFSLGSPSQQRVATDFCRSFRADLVPTGGSMRIGTNRRAIQQRPTRSFHASGAGRLAGTVAELEHFARTFPQLDSAGRAVAQTVTMGLGRSFFMVNIGLTGSTWSDPGELIWLYPSTGRTAMWPTREMAVDLAV